MKKRKPSHIGIIPDGNRRWAVGHGLTKEKGYYYGLEPGLNVLRQAVKYGIEEISFYGFTTDNCKRPKEQVASFSKACIEAVKLMSAEGIDLLVLGNTKSKCFPDELRDYTKRTTINGGGIKVNLLVNYGWKWDLSKIKTDNKPYSLDVSRIDMIIRWGGMRRLSGFLPIQSVYSDFYVEDKMWPDYNDEDFVKALEWYEKQDITYGG